MPALPRLITVDPTGAVGQIVRAAIDLSEYACRQVDVPTGAEALDELALGGCQLLLATLDVADMKAFELALKVNQVTNGATACVILAAETDPDIDDETLSESPFVYLKRPLNFAQFTRVLFAGIRGERVRDALNQPQATAQAAADLGPVPTLDLEQARRILDTLLYDDIGGSARSVLLMSRAGEVLLERGTNTGLNRDKLAVALMPSAHSYIEMRQLAGTDTSSLVYFDAEKHDIFVLSVGLHHLLTLVFDDNSGLRQFGAVNRYGRRAVENLIALLGVNAFIVAPPVAPAEAPLKAALRTVEVAAAPVADELPTLERAPEFSAPAPEPVRLDAIPDDQFDLSFLDAEVDEAALEAMFNPDALAELAANSRRPTRGGTIDWDQAQDVGLLGGEG